MKPVSPVFRKRKMPEVVYGKSQPEYQPLPAVSTEDGVVVSRWHLSLRDRIRAFFTGDVYLTVLTFNRSLQPVLLETTEPQLNEVKEERCSEFAQ